mmetsp:Transcript_12876/g.27336  ORF Transcript_12876/g.27336 Transcript_12876/m.27336 type:complete len:205 (-) Transcript_12876:264-878(-)
MIEEVGHGSQTQISILFHLLISRLNYRKGPRRQCNIIFAVLTNVGNIVKCSNEVFQSFPFVQSLLRRVRWQASEAKVGHGGTVRKIPRQRVQPGVPWTFCAQFVFLQHFQKEIELRYALGNFGHMFRRFQVDERLFRWIVFCTTATQLFSRLSSREYQFVGYAQYGTIRGQILIRDCIDVEAIVGGEFEAGSCLDAIITRPAVQ